MAAAVQFVVCNRGTQLGSDAFECAFKLKSINSMASKVKKKPSASKQPAWFVAGISTHHLLNHKPDNLLAKGGKHGLRGW